MDLLVKAAFFVVGCLIIRAIWRACGPDRHFVVELRQGEPRVVSGTVTPAFLRLVRDIAGWNEVKSGRVIGISRGAGIGLEFSRSFPAAARQQIRNGWGTMGWGAGRGGARPR